MKIFNRLKYIFLNFLLYIYDIKNISEDRRLNIY